MNINFLKDFGITPSNTYISAGSDFYFPKVVDGSPESLKALKAYEKSYKKDKGDIMTIAGYLMKYAPSDKMANNLANVLHLYLALQSYDLETILDDPRKGEENAVEYFCNNYLVFDDNNVPGIKIRQFDKLFVNSGIKVNLPASQCGLYVNKSGMGNKGFSVLACLVDEDYGGYVHLSMIYLAHTHKDQIIYCGDKLTQMMIFNITHGTWNEVEEKDYDELMSFSKRGADGFGSSDVKH